MNFRAIPPNYESEDKTKCPCGLILTRPNGSISFCPCGRQIGADGKVVG